jgi:hypothetical protein
MINEYKIICLISSVFEFRVFSTQYLCVKELVIVYQSVDGTSSSCLAMFFTVAKMKKATNSTTLWVRAQKFVLTVAFLIFATVKKHGRARSVYGLFIDNTDVARVGIICIYVYITRG